MATILGNLSALDADADDVFTYELLDDAGGRFQIQSGNQLVISGPVDFEQTPSLVVRVQVLDASGAAFAKNLVVAVTNQNEAPTDIAISNSSIVENSSPGTLVGTLSAIDPDTGARFAYSLLDNAGGRFQIANGNQLLVSGSLDFEQATAHTVRVQVADSEGSSSPKTFTISVGDQSPFFSSCRDSVAENSRRAPGRQARRRGVASARRRDLQPGRESRRPIRSRRGQPNPGHPAARLQRTATHTIVVRATSNGVAVTQSLVIKVININEAPRNKVSIPGARPGSLIRSASSPTAAEESRSAIRTRARATSGLLSRARR